MATAANRVNTSKLRQQHYTPRSARHLVKVISERDTGLRGIIIDCRRSAGHRLPDGTSFVFGAARTAVQLGMYVVWKRLRTRNAPFGIGQDIRRWRQQTRSIATQIDQASSDDFLTEVFARHAERGADR